MNLWVLDEREVWWRAIIDAGARHGYQGKRIRSGRETQGQSGIGFIRPHADPKRLKINIVDYHEMANSLLMIQDADQVELYEEKSKQFFLWGDLMPTTWHFESLEPAMELLQACDYPIVSKADVGASSVNVRILADRKSAEKHVRQIFGPGIPVNHCAGGAKSLQHDYVLLQRFIPHQITWRVNAIGNARAVFLRYCYPDRPVAQTGNVEPAMEMTPEIESLLEYSDRVFERIGSKWCALDILKEGDDWKLLETSLAWPWPSPGKCNEGPIFRTERLWIEMFDVMFEEFQRGAWG